MRPFLTRKSVSTLVLLSAAIAAGATAGCRQDGLLPDEATSPSPAASVDVSPRESEFYPLAVGNSWVFDRKYTIEIEVVIGPPYHTLETYEGTTEYRITGTEVISGVEYLAEHATLTVPDRPETARTRSFLRQDRAGFYGADVPLACGAAPSPGDAFERRHRGALPEGVPAFAAAAWREQRERHEAARRSLGSAVGMLPSAAGRPGGVLEEELRYLAYPLHTKASWFNRTEPFTVRSEVEGHEVIDLPAGSFPAYRIRLESRFLDEDDRAVVWYSRCGRVAFSIHTEIWAMDIETGETALITIDETERLREIDLGGRPGCEKNRAGGGR